MSYRSSVRSHWRESSCGWSRGRAVATTLVALVLLLGVAGCSSDGKGAGASSSTSGGTLTLGNNAGPTAMNPALMGNNVALWWAMPAYEPLLEQQADGSYEGLLATKRGYVGQWNMKFLLTVRGNVQFSDGSPLTADAVANSLKYFQTACWPNQSLLESFKSITSAGDKVTIEFSQPTPGVESLFSQFWPASYIISPKGLSTGSTPI